MQFIETFVTLIITFAINELHQDMANAVIEVAKVGFNNFKSDGYFNIHYRQVLLYSFTMVLHCNYTFLNGME
jgi:hypothetical protein